MPRRSSRMTSTMITMTTMVPIPMYTGVAPLSRYCVPSQAAERALATRGIGPKTRCYPAAPGRRPPAAGAA